VDFSERLQENALAAGWWRKATTMSEPSKNPPNDDDRDDTPESASEGDAAPVTAKQGLLRRLVSWAFGSLLRTVFVVGGCLASIGGFLVLWIYFTLPTPQTPKQTPPRHALELFDEHEFAEARELAERFHESKEPLTEDAGTPSYVLGLLARRDALKRKDAGRKIIHLLAAQYFDESRSRGFPPGREAEGLLLLGKSLHAGGRYAVSRPILRDAAALVKDQATNIHLLLAEGFLHDPKPDYPSALAEVDAYLAASTLSPDERVRGRLLKSEVFLWMDKTSEALKAIGDVSAEGKLRDDVTVMQAWIRIQEARAIKDKPDTAQAKYREAMELLRKVQDQLKSRAARQATYLIGVCLLETGDQRGAMAQFTRTRMLYPGDPEAIVADFQEAEIWRQTGRDKEALAAYRRFLRGIGDVDGYNNPWFSLTTLRRRTVEAYQYYLDAKNYAVCLALTRCAMPLFAKDRMVLMNAETHRAWGLELLAQSKNGSAKKAREATREARAHFRAAGELFERLAALRITTRYYIDDLWESAHAFLQGQDYRNAARMLSDYLKNEPRSRRAQALTELGECQLALDHLDEAIGTLKQTLLLYPRDITAYRARILASRVHLEKLDYAEAEALLNENLRGESLTPVGREWRQSLFLLGEVLYRSQRYPEAIRRLEEAVQRYGDGEDVLKARCFIADAYWQVAKTEAKQLAKDRVDESRVGRVQRIHDALEVAFERNRAASEALLKHQETNDLDSSEKAMLRNGYFAMGSLLVELGRYEEAVGVFTTIANRYQNSPEVLEAYVQLSRAFRLSNRPEESRRVIEQAKLILARMKPQTPFLNTTNYDHKGWEDLLQSLGKN
jgi:TolA-binding protein